MLNILRDVRIWVKAKELRNFFVWHPFDDFDVLIIAVSEVREFVKVLLRDTATIRVVCSEYFLREKIVENGR